MKMFGTMPVSSRRHSQRRLDGIKTAIALFDLPSLEGVEEVVISKEVVEGTARPLYIYARADWASDASASQDESLAARRLQR